jgi:hypothetical protein
MREPFDLANLDALFERAAERSLAVRNLLLDGLDGEPIHITPQAFRQQEVLVCSTHPLTGLTTEPQFRMHLRRHHPTGDDPCSHCDWDMRVVSIGSFLGLALPSPVQVTVIEGVRTRLASWQGTVHFQWHNDVCPNCRAEVVR